MTGLGFHGGDARKSEAGFTLLELLVAITLMALLSVVLLGGLRFGARVWEESERHNTRGNEVRNAQMHLREKIEQAWPYFDTTDPTKPHVRFRGDSQSLEFLAPVPPDLAPGGYAEVEVVTASKDGMLRLVMQSRPELAAAEGMQHREVLLDGLLELKISYFGADASSIAPAWHDEWQDQKRLPGLVRIDAAFAPEDGRHWPSFIVAPKIEADVSCAFDPLTHFCRGR